MTTSTPDPAHAALAPMAELMPRIDNLYKDLHEHPELSLMEKRTAGMAAQWLRDAGYQVTEGIGGTGVVGLLKNGDGPTVLLRGDMDALPVREETGLPYASTVTAKDHNGQTVPVMHACGHDAHTSCLAGAATLLAKAKSQWCGTLMVVFQPAEELVAGALAMVQDGLYQKVARPDVALGQHIIPFPAGVIAHRSGPTMAASYAMGVTIHGKGGHGSAPDATVDPVVIAAYIVTRLQTIVAREISPSERAVVTVGLLQAGIKDNVIPNDARMELNIRSYSSTIQTQILEAIKRIVRAECEAGRAPRPPEFKELYSTIATVNDAATMERVKAAHAAFFGKDRLVEMPQLNGSEDFPYFGASGPGRFDGPDIPYAYWFVGATSHDTWAKAQGDTWEQKVAQVPFNHNSHFAPDREITLKAGVEALTTAALEFLK